MKGTAYHKIINRMEPHEAFQAFREGTMELSHYVSWINSNEELLMQTGLTRDEVHLSGRLRFGEKEYVDGLIRHLYEEGLIPSCAYDKPAFDAARERIYALFDHGQRTTYIFPEEERLAFAVASILKPKSIGVFGSYYCYWAIWAIVGAGATLEQAVCVDTDDAVNALARQNFSKLGIEQVDVITADAVKYLSEVQHFFDLSLVDAEGPEDHPDPVYRKKNIYTPIVRQLLPRKCPGSVIMLHNMLLENRCVADEYFNTSVEKNRKSFAPMFELFDRHRATWTSFETSEGVGVCRC